MAFLRAAWLYERQFLWHPCELPGSVARKGSQGARSALCCFQTSLPLAALPL